MAVPTITDTLVGTKFIEYKEPTTNSFNIGDIVNLVENTTQSNSTSSLLNSTALNLAYPNAMIGFRVQCTNSSVLKIYEKTNTTAWVSYSITVV
jgi:hypothetical protein